MKTKKAKTAVELMRARYSAYVNVQTDFLLESLHPDRRASHDSKETRDWAAKSKWDRLEILNTEKGGEGDDTGTVEFIAYYTVKNDRTRHHELATFVKIEDEWFFDDGVGVTPKQFVRPEPKIGRNDPCACGSGKKFKKCCGQ
jgi:SEC-C motif-containing protein